MVKPEKGGAAELHEQAQVLARRGVKLLLCENTMKGAKLTRRDLMPFASTVSSVLGELVRKQTDGLAYFKL